MLPQLNLFIDIQRRMLNGTEGRTSNLLLKGSRVFCPVTRSSLTTTLLFQLGSPVTHRVLEYKEHSFIDIQMALRDQSPMFPRFCPSPSGITVRSRKRLWQLCLLSRSFSSICLVKNLSWLLTTSLYSLSMAIRSLQVWWQTVWPVEHCT